MDVLEDFNFFAKVCNSLVLREMIKILICQSTEEF